MLFESQDKDQNGKLSWQEFSGQESKNEKAFKLMDADHNGKISKNVSLIFCPKGEDFVIFSFAGVQESLPPPDKGAGEINHQTHIYEIKILSRYKYEYKQITKSNISYIEQNKKVKKNVFVVLQTLMLVICFVN